MKKNKKDIKNVVENLCAIISEAELFEHQIAEVLPQFLFSIGASLSNCKGLSSEEVLKQYGTNPTFANALMAQALWMKETWTVEEDSE